CSTTSSAASSTHVDCQQVGHLRVPLLVSTGTTTPQRRNHVHVQEGLRRDRRRAEQPVLPALGVRRSWAGRHGGRRPGRAVGLSEPPVRPGEVPRLRPGRPVQGVRGSRLRRRRVTAGRARLWGRARPGATRHRQLPTRRYIMTPITIEVEVVKAYADQVDELLRHIAEQEERFYITAPGLGALGEVEVVAARRANRWRLLKGL